MSAIQIGFCWGFRGVTPEDGVPRLKQFGFEGIELWPDFLKAWGASRWAAALQMAKMECFQLCPYFDFVSGPLRLAQSRQMLDEYLAAARVLGCRRLRVFTGPPWGEGVVGASAASEAQWQSAIDGLQEYCDVAARDGVELCLECHEGSLMEDSPSALRLLRAVGRPNLATNLQLPLRAEDWRISLRELGRFTTHVHIHNWAKEMVDVSRGELTFLDAGIFDWRPVVRYLVVDLGRNVCLSVEHTDHAGRDDPWETARRDGPYLQHLRAWVMAG